MTLCCAEGTSIDFPEEASDEDRENRNKDLEERRSSGESACVYREKDFVSDGGGYTYHYDCLANTLLPTAVAVLSLLTFQL